MFHAKGIPTHGGSMRYYIQKKGVRKKTTELKKILKYEKIKITKIETMKKFVKNA